jgi:hypothetical protein
MIITQIPIDEYKTEIIMLRGWFGPKPNLPEPILLQVMRQIIQSMYDNKTI